MADKVKERQILQLLVKEFLEKGGEIQQIPEGKKGKRLPKEPPLFVHKQPSGARCLICDWSPTDSRSIMNPEIEEYPGNRLVLDDLTGDMLCKVCLSAVSNMNYDFKIEKNPNHGLSRYILSRDARKLLESGLHVIPGQQQVYDPILGHISEGVRRKTISHED